MPQLTVGQLGLGNMGSEVAQHLIDEGFDVIGYDISEDAIDSFEEYGGTPAERPPTSKPTPISF